ncbi:hypothetical protein MGSAQ_000314 [marine sediment metagenome]|uniref:Uncharacterized protein n=1 Tax=marine sediment metagenome TaxID=412755 RepID=A0A1B6NYP8_9ZZZZ
MPAACLKQVSNCVVKVSQCSCSILRRSKIEGRLCSTLPRLFG